MADKSEKRFPLIKWRNIIEKTSKQRIVQKRNKNSQLSKSMKYQK